MVVVPVVIHHATGFLDQAQNSLGSQALCLSDMALCDFWFFPKLKRCQFVSRETVMANAAAQMFAVPEQEATHIQNVFSNGRPAGLSVWTNKGTIMKDIRIESH